MIKIKSRESMDISRLQYIFKYFDDRLNEDGHEHTLKLRKREYNHSKPEVQMYKLLS